MFRGSLIKKISIDEDTESIITSLNVSGADGVDIRSVNPMGTNSIIELGYFMTLDNFSQAMIDKYDDWKETFESYQRSYFNLTIEEALKTAQLLTEQAVLTRLQGELTSLENTQAVTIQAIAQRLKSQSDLDEVNRQITAKKKEISDKEAVIAVVKVNVENLNSQMVEINNRTRLDSFFTADEYKILSRYLKEDSITEDSFVVPTVDTYDAAGESVKLSGSIFNITNSAVTKVENQFGKDIYSIAGGSISCSTAGFALQANVVRASLDFDTDKQLLFTVRLNSGKLNDVEFPNACISISGKATAVTSNVVADSDTDGAYAEGTSLSFRLGSVNLYFTRSTTEYEQRSVEWDLFDYGKSLIEKVAWPSYSCSLDIINFLALNEFEPFKNKLELGSKLYWKQRNGKILKPILVRVKIPFENLSNFEVGLSSKYNASDAEFTYQDLIEDGVNAGKTLDSGKWTYNQFVNSGAETSLSKFMKSAMDVAKNSIISSSGQHITWDKAGFRLRKLKDGSETEFEPYQIWMNNSSIMFSTDGWNTANLAIGQIVSEDGNILSGVIADSLIGKMIASNSMIIECVKENGGEMVFRADSSGVSLHNAIFDIYNTDQLQITLNPYSGIAIGKYPLYSGDKYTINEANAKFWADTKGNLHLKGTLEGVNGTFSGELVAATGRFKGVVQASDFQDLSGRSMLNNNYQFNSKYLNLLGLNVGNGNLVIDSGGNISMRGNINMTGGSISWGNINEKGSAAYQTAVDAQIYANQAFNAAADASGEAAEAARIAKQIADGKYTKGTFISGREIFSPTIRANEFAVQPSTEGNGVGGYSLYGYYGNQLYEMFRIGYFAGDAPYVNLGSAAGAYANWNFGKTNFYGNIDFDGANVSGIDATFA